MESSFAQNKVQQYGNTFLEWACSIFVTVWLLGGSLEGTTSPYDICLEFPVVLCFSGAVSFPWSWSLQESWGLQTRTWKQHLVKLNLSQRQKKTGLIWTWARQTWRQTRRSGFRWCSCGWAAESDLLWLSWLTASNITHVRDSKQTTKIKKQNCNE